MSGQGPPTLFIYYQKAYKLNDQGDDVEDSYKNAHPEFVVTDGKFELPKIENFPSIYKVFFQSINQWSYQEVLLKKQRKWTFC